MTARFVVDGCTFYLVHIEVKDMDNLKNDEKTKDLEAYPLYFDSNKRTWPKHDIDVEFRE